MKVIINADDCGKDAIVDAAIEDCIKKGEITSTTIMANGLDFCAVKKLYDTYPQISFGVHLVLDEMESLTKANVLKRNGLVDENGYFIKSGYTKAIYDNELDNAIFEEWCAQIDKIQNAGIVISHIDSHHHAHTYNKHLVHITNKIALKYGIDKIRLNMWLPLRHKKHIKTPKGGVQSAKTSTPERTNYIQKLIGLYQKLFIFKNIKRQYKTADLFMPVRTYLFSETYIKTKLHVDTLELMCHPGHPAYDEETKSLYKITNCSKINYKDL